MKRRSFFKNVMAVVATVALAPEIAFRSKLELPKHKPPEKVVGFWMQTGRATMCYDDGYVKAFTAMAAFKAL